MDPLAYPIFSLVSAFMRSQYFTVMDAAYLRFVDSVGVIALGIETLYVMNYGFVISTQKSSEDEKNPDMEELIYHGMVVAIVIGLIKYGGTLALDAAMGIRGMIVEGLTGSSAPAGQQIATWLGLIDAAFSLISVANTVVVTADAAPVKHTAITLALIGQGSPQIVGGILLLFSELTVRTGMALFPIALYSSLYQPTKDILMTWIGLMLALTIQMSAAAITIKLGAEVTGIFCGAFAGIIAAQAKLPIGSPIVSEMQQSVIQAGFGMTLSVVISYFPMNVGDYAGPFLKMAGITLENTVGMLYKNDRTVTKRDWSRT